MKSRATSSGSDESRRPFRKFHPRELAYSRQKLTRRTVRRVNCGPPHARPRGQYEAIVDRLGAMADREDRKAGPLERRNNSLSAHSGGSVYKKSR